VSAPLVVTLAVEPGAQQRFDAERHRLFPAGGPDAGAHIALFCAVPGYLEERARVDLVRVAGSPFPVGVAGVLPLARGAAYALAAPELARRQKELRELWWEHLTPRDQEAFRPHVTVQNGVSPAEARATVTLLRRAFRPHQIRAEGFVLWRDDGGPWTELARIPFSDSV
jgi:2'-5' RNA ligase